MSTKEALNFQRQNGLQLLESEVKRRLPIPLKRILRKLVYPENFHRGVITKTIDGIEAQFLIQTRSDWRRIISEFEVNFSKIAFGGT